MLREAPRPRRTPWFSRNGWTIPVGLCVAFGGYSVLWDRRAATGLGFLLGGWLIWRMFRSAE